jgi:hypothetical protein
MMELTQTKLELPEWRIAGIMCISSHIVSRKERKGREQDTNFRCGILTDLSEAKQRKNFSPVTPLQLSQRGCCRTLPQSRNITRRSGMNAAPRKRQQRFILQPRVAERARLPWGHRSKMVSNPERVASFDARFDSASLKLKLILSHAGINTGFRAQ